MTESKAMSPYGDSRLDWGVKKTKRIVVLSPSIVIINLCNVVAHSQNFWVNLASKAIVH